MGKGRKGRARSRYIGRYPFPSLVESPPSLGFPLLAEVPPKLKSSPS